MFDAFTLQGGWNYPIPLEKLKKMLNSSCCIYLDNPPEYPRLNIIKEYTTKTTYTDIYLTDSSNCKTSNINPSMAIVLTIIGAVLTVCFGVICLIQLISSCIKNDQEREPLLTPNIIEIDNVYLNNICAICRKEESPPDTLFHPCGHKIVHKKCFNLNKKRCPYCNKPIETIIHCLNKVV